MTHAGTHMLRAPDYADDVPVRAYTSLLSLALISNILDQNSAQTHSIDYDIPSHWVSQELRVWPGATRHRARQEHHTAHALEACIVQWNG